MGEILVESIHVSAASHTLKAKLANRVAGMVAPYEVVTVGDEITSPVTPIVLKVDEEPLSVQTCKELSNYLSGRAHRPIFILPYGEPKHQGFQIGQYCRFTAKIIGTVDESAIPFEVYRVRKHLEQPEKHGVMMRHYSVQFGTEPVGKGQIKFEEHLAHQVTVYAHSAIAGKMKILVFSNRLLDPGSEYYLDGLVFNASKISQMGLSMSGKMPIAWCENARNMEDTLTIRQDVLDKCKGKPTEWFTKSVCYPFDKGVWTYLDLVTYSVFHAQVGFPFNVMLIGDAAMTKTAFLRKLSAITGDDLIAQSRPKGLMPHFGGSVPEAGALVEARFKALLNEFFENFSSLSPYERSEMLSNFKHILEGAEGTAVSGKGKTKFLMKADLFAATNYPKRQNSTRDSVQYRNITEFYNDFDKALLDRILFYPIPSGHKEYVAANRSGVAQLERDCGKDLSKLPYAEMGLLTCEELRNIMYYLRTVKVVINPEDEQVGINELMEILPEGCFSRHREFLANVASAVAAIRSFSEGTLSNENRVVHVSKDDLYYARLFLATIIDLYKEHDAAMRSSIVSSLPKLESALFGNLARHHSEHENPYAKAVEWVQWLEWLGGDEVNGKKVAEKFQANKLCRFNGAKIIYTPDLSAEASHCLAAVEEGVQPAKEQDFLARYLVNQGLVARDRDGKYLPLFAGLGSGQSTLNAPAQPALVPTKVVGQVVETRFDLLVRTMRSRIMRSDGNGEDLLWGREELVDRGFASSEVDEAKTKGFIIEPRAGRFTPSRLTEQQIQRIE